MSHDATVESPSGVLVDIEHPDPATITVDDIAHKLAQTNRWGGSAAYPYSVAAHAVFVSERLAHQGADEVDQLIGLHHDSAEAFLGDIPRPWKRLLAPMYGELTMSMDAAIGVALGLPPIAGGHWSIIKQADDFAMLVEAQHLMPSQGRWGQQVDSDNHPRRGEAGMPRVIRTPPYWRGEIHWTVARDEFLYRHNQLVA